MKTIRIGKSWHFWVYDLGYQLLHGVDCAPSRVSLCLYCLHAAIGIFLAPLALVALVWFVLLGFVHIGCMLFVGVRPVGWSIKEPFCEEFVSYDGLKIGKFSLYPGHLIAFLAVAGTFYCVQPPIRSYLIGVLCLSVLSLSGVMWFVVGGRKLKFLVPLWMRLVSWFRAEKEELCPMIEIVETRSEAELEGGD